jgi:Holliday junction DNA helicase RuvA
MICRLEGKLHQKSPDYVVIDVNGVGYCVHVPLSTFYELPDAGQITSLSIYTYVREDTLQLYGFRTMAEKEMFIHLITVNGIGPRLAVNILSGINADQLRQVVLQQDRARLQGIPGVGKKTAERIILELKDKLKGKSSADEHLVAVSLEVDVYADAFSALLNLGYKSAEAERALKRAQMSMGESPGLSDLLREALRLMA